MSDRTDTKLRETKFFFQNLIRESGKESPNEPEAFLFYLNAFLTAGESVRCFLEEDYGYERQKAGGVFKFMKSVVSSCIGREVPMWNKFGYMFRSGNCVIVVTIPPLALISSRPLELRCL
jgi:hypothetical protein